MWGTYKYLRKVAMLKKLETKLQKLTRIRDKAKADALKIQALYEATQLDMVDMKKV
jgi:hypothetical protein